MRTTLAILRIAVVVMVIAARAYAQPGMTEPAPPPPPPPVLAPPLAPPPAPPVEVATPAEPPEYHAVCLEGRPFKCGSVFLLEAGPRWGTASVWTADIGVLIHSGRYAFGATFGGMVYTTPGNATGDGSKLYKARFRRYLGDDGAAFDAALGFDDDARSAEIAFGYRDLIAITAGAHTVEGDPDRRYGMNVGVRVGAEVIGTIVYIVGSIAGNAR